jgi:hypothetical protein
MASTWFSGSKLKACLRPVRVLIKICVCQNNAITTKEAGARGRKQGGQGQSSRVAMEKKKSGEEGNFLQRIDPAKLATKYILAHLHFESWCVVKRKQREMLLKSCQWMDVMVGKRCGGKRAPLRVPRVLLSVCWKRQASYR